MGDACLLETVNHSHVLRAVVKLVLHALAAMVRVKRDSRSREARVQ